MIRLRACIRAEDLTDSARGSMGAGESTSPSMDSEGQMQVTKEGHVRIVRKRNLNVVFVCAVVDFILDYFSSTEGISMSLLFQIYCLVILHTIGFNAQSR